MDDQSFVKQLCRAHIESCILLQQAFLDAEEMEDFDFPGASRPAMLCVEYSVLLFEISLFRLSASSLPCVDIPSYLSAAHLLSTKKVCSALENYFSDIDAPFSAVTHIDKAIDHYTRVVTGKAEAPFFGTYRPFLEKSFIEKTYNDLFNIFANRLLYFFETDSICFDEGDLNQDISYFNRFEIETYLPIIHEYLEDFIKELNSFFVKTPPIQKRVQSSAPALKYTDGQNHSQNGTSYKSRNSEAEEEKGARRGALIFFAIGITFFLMVFLFGKCSNSNTPNASKPSSRETTSSTACTYKAAEVTTEAAPSTAQLPSVPEPQSGEILYGKKYDDSEITIKASYSSSCVVLLKTASGDACLSFYVRAGDTVTVGVPAKSLYAYFASGKNWYGYGDGKMFGKNTDYSRDTQLLDFANYTYTYTLYSVSYGNFSETPCKESDFFS